MTPPRRSLVAVTFAAATLLAGCSTTQMVANKEDHLAAAGFVDRPANTATRQEMLAKLPANQFVRRVHGDKVAYVYADPKVCGCLYVGNQRAYGKYKAFMERQHLADEQQMTAMDYNDAAWNWNAWGGGWGPAFGPGFWGPGIGW